MEDIATASCCSVFGKHSNSLTVTVVLGSNELVFTCIFV